MKNLFRFLLLIVIIGCDNGSSNSGDKPTISTLQITNITGYTATGGGNVISEGSSAVTARGVCWSISQNPTIEDGHTADLFGVGSFNSLITGLTPNTAYHVRAYATNNVGTAYGSEVGFITTSEIGGRPIITTAPITNTTTTSTNCGGNVVTDSGAIITARGVCWSTSHNPTTADSKTTNGTGTGDFTSTVSGLSPNSTYFLRAYATNGAGTGYGNEVILKTYTGTVSDFDGNFYYTVTIGSQIWMAMNLRTTHYRDGSAIPNISDNTQWANQSTGAYCNYNNDTTKARIYGRLYNWFAVSDGRNLAPLGWHVATDAEWTTLITYLGGDTVAGGKLKEAGFAHWDTPNAGATNESGYTALPSGYRDIQLNQFLNIGNQGRWWSATENSSTDVWNNAVYAANTSVFRNYLNKTYGFSIRCVKDQ